MFIYHIASKQDWAAAQQKGSYTADSLTTQGFIHFSDENQVVRTANSFYRGRPDLLLLQVDTDRLNAQLVYEESEPGEKFPHLYGALNLDAVSAVQDFIPKADGSFEMPVFE